MGLFDSLAKQVLSGMAGGQGGQQDMMSDVLGGLLNQSGGLEGLLGKAKEIGIEDKVGSWIGTGDNQAVTPNQMENLLGSDAVQGVASKLGLNVQQILPLLAQFLPLIIDQLTPKGKIEQGATSAEGLDLNSVLASVMKSSGGSGGLGGLSGLLGGLLGGQQKN